MKSKWANTRRFAYALPAIHAILLTIFCLKDIEGIVEEIGIIDFPLTIAASPVLMNVDVSVFWIVLYYFMCGSGLWYFAGKVLDRWIAVD